VLVEERDDSLVCLLVLSLDLLVIEVGTRRHEAVNLTIEALKLLGHLQSILKLLDRVCIFVARSNHEQGHLDARCLRGVEHGWVALSTSRKLAELVGRDDGNDLAAPAELCICWLDDGSFLTLLGCTTYSEDTPGLDAGVLLVDCFDEAGKLAHCGLGVACGAEELAKRTIHALRHPAHLGRLSVKEIRHEDLVLARVRKQIGALNGLVEVAEDVVDDEDGLGGVRRTSDIYIGVSHMR
jgi:DNA-binding transcriptional LysR family regulator